MKILKSAALWSLLVLCSLVVLGCGDGGQEADETKPMSEVKAEAEKMDNDDLRATALSYKEAITAKKGEIEKIVAKLKEIPVAEMMGEEAKALKADIADLNKAVTALKERFDVYYAKLKAAGGDTSGLEI